MRAFASIPMFCRRLPNLFRLHATIFACSKMCLCVIYVIVRCCILVPGIYDSDLDPDTLDCWLSFAHSSIRSVCEWFTSGSNPLTDKSWKPLYHYELLRHAVKNVAVFTTNLCFLSYWLLQARCLSVQGKPWSIFFRYQVFSTTLRHCSWGHLFYRGRQV